MDDIQNAVESLSKLNPTQLAEVLSILSRIYIDDAMELEAAWQEANAGKVWEIAASGLRRTADDMQIYWNSL